MKLTLTSTLYTFTLLGLLLFTSLMTAACDRQKKSHAEQPTVTTAQQNDGLIIAVGDSLTAGLGVSEPDAWPALLENKLRGNDYNWQVINAGISGETSSGTLSRIKWIVAQKPNIVILETGANDGFRGIPPPVILDNIRQTVQLLQKNDVTVVLAGMQIVQNLGPEYTSGFAGIYPAVAGECGCILIPFLLDNVAGDPALNQEDSIHPNTQGHIVISETVYPFVRKAIEENR